MKLPSSIFYLFLFSIFIKITAALALPVFGDESYYWFWGQNIQLSYFDHPGMVGWLTAVGAQLSFLPLKLVVRWPFILVSSLSFWIFIKIVIRQNLNTVKTSLWLAVFYLLNPMLGVGGVFATPDVGLVFFWTLSQWLVLEILEKQKSRDYIFLGISLGLGFCSKYHIVLFPACLLLELFFSKKISLISRKLILLTILFGFIFSLPVLIWNFQNDWSSFAFQLNHGFSRPSYNPMWSVSYIFGQFFLFNPFLMVYFFQKAKRVDFYNSANFQWLFFLISSFKASVEANWPIAAHAQALSVKATVHKKYFYGAFAYALVFWICALVFLFTPLGEKKLLALPNSKIASNVWAEVSQYSPLYGPTYQLSSLLQLVSGQQILKLSQLSRIDFYDSHSFKLPTHKIFYSLKYDITTWPDWLKGANIDLVKKIPDYNLALYRISRE